MKEDFTIAHEFVEFAPKERKEGVVYVSIPYATAVHNCFCGCGLRVVTPISPAGWQLTYDGETVSLHPSVGNWSFPCRSHYWIKRDEVIWAGDMSMEDIDAGRASDRALREAHYGKAAASSKPKSQKKPPRKKGLWKWLIGRD